MPNFRAFLLGQNGFIQLIQEKHLKYLWIIQHFEHFENLWKKKTSLYVTQQDLSRSAQNLKEAHIKEILIDSIRVKKYHQSENVFL